MAKVVSGLVSFETYAKDCENRNEEDGRIHVMLDEASARACVGMKQTMTELLRFEDLHV